MRKRKVLDTAKGGYLCYYCAFPLKANQHQFVIGTEKYLKVVCDDCEDRIMFGFKAPSRTQRSI